MRHQIDVPGVGRGMSATLSSGSAQLTRIIDEFVIIQRSEETRRAYRCDARQALSHLDLYESSISALSELPFHQLQNELAEYLEAAAKRNPQGHVVNGNTLSRKRYTLVKFFRYLMEVHGFGFNPAIGLPRYRKSDKSNTAILDEQELCVLIQGLRASRLDSEKAYRDFLLVLTLAIFALRRRELVSLEWPHICLKPSPHFRLFQKGNREKLLPIPDWYLEDLQKFALLFGQPSKYIFYSVGNNRAKDFGRPLATGTIRNVVIQAAEKYLPGRVITPHSFRATFICISRENGQDDRAIMNATGLSTGEMINYYDIRSLLQTNAINFFANILK